MSACTCDGRSCVRPTCPQHGGVVDENGRPPTPIRGHVGWSPDYRAFTDKRGNVRAIPDDEAAALRKLEASQEHRAAAIALAEAVCAIDEAYPSWSVDGWRSDPRFVRLDDAVDNALTAYRAARERLRGET